MCICCRWAQSIVRIKKREKQKTKEKKRKKKIQNHEKVNGLKWQILLTTKTAPAFHSPEQRKHKIYCQKETKRNTLWKKKKTHTETKTHHHVLPWIEWSGWKNLTKINKKKKNEFHRRIEMDLWTSCLECSLNAHSDEFVWCFLPFLFRLSISCLLFSLLILCWIFRRKNMELSFCNRVVFALVYCNFSFSLLFIQCSDAMQPNKIYLVVSHLGLPGFWNRK